MSLPDPSRQPDAVTAFLAVVPPFDRLPPDERAILATAGRVELFLEGETIAEAQAQGVPVEPAVCCIQRGSVAFVGQGDGPGLADARGEGECFGLGGALPGNSSSCRAVAAGDVFLVRLPGAAFAAMAKRHPFVAAYFANCLDKQACRVDDGPGLDAAEADGDYLFTRLAGEVASPGIVSVARGTDLPATARVMEESGVGSVLVREASGTVIGIVTDRDLRRAVARGMGLTAPVETLMSAPVAAIDAATPCFEALSRMTEAGIRHLLVTREGSPFGLVTANDLLLAHGRSPMALLRAIRRAAGLDDLVALSHRAGPLAEELAACRLGGGRLLGPVRLSGLAALAAQGRDLDGLDLLPAVGGAVTMDAVRQRLATDRPDPGLMLSALGAVVARPTPLGVHQGKLAERAGGFAPAFDLDGRGSGAVAAMARLAAVFHGLPQLGTAGRLAALAAGGHLPGEVAQNAGQAWAFFEGERLAARLAGQADPDVVPRPGALSARKRQECRAAFAAVEALRQTLAGMLGRLEAGQ
ncbi:MAG TPA: putative nucleotidyltransferase substrate binding domain-containing protein [Solidesulfovibrio magneticus]|nr:putative nucleotidyltransferase substrate binding domain-containing protein [Solidesulfovibrio magneticus]